MGPVRKRKRGGVRVIYYFHDEARPLYLITLFAKSDLSPADKKDVSAFAKMVKSRAKHEKDRKN